MSKLILTIAGFLGATALFLSGLHLASTPPVLGGSTTGALCKSASATTTLAYMTAGTATTTFTCPLGTDSAQVGALFVQFTGSSTSSTLKAEVEYSNDGVDWYRDTYSDYATGTPSLSLANPDSYLLTYASSSVGGVGGVGDGRNTRVIKIQTPAKSLRVILSLPAASLNGAVYAEVLPKTIN